MRFHSAALKAQIREGDPLKIRKGLLNGQVEVVTELSRWSMLRGKQEPTCGTAFRRFKMRRMLEGGRRLDLGLTKMPNRSGSCTSAGKKRCESGIQVSLGRVGRTNGELKVAPFGFAAFFRNPKDIIVHVGVNGEVQELVGKRGSLW